MFHPSALNLVNSIGKRAKTLNKMHKRQGTSKVLLVQETERSNSSMMPSKPIKRNKHNDLLNPGTSHKKVNSYCSGSASMSDLRLHFGFNPSCKSPKEPKIISETGRESEQHKLLKSKLSKFTSCTNKVRRSRKERKNCNVESSGSLLTISKSNANMSLQNEKVTLKQNLSSANMILKVPKINSKFISTKKSYDKLPSGSAVKVPKTSEKKLTCPNKCLARKYLSGLYDKVLVKVKDIERNKRYPLMKKNEKANVQLMKNLYQNVKSRVKTKPAITTEIVFIH